MPAELLAPIQGQQCWAVWVGAAALVQPASAVRSAREKAARKRSDLPAGSGSVEEANIRPPPKPSARMTNVVPTPAKKMRAFDGMVATPDANQRSALGSCSALEKIGRHVKEGATRWPVGATKLPATCCLISRNPTAAVFGRRFLGEC